MGVVGDNPQVAVESRIVEIMSLIALNQWKYYTTPRELAERWGVGLNRIYAYVMEAKRRLQVDLAIATQRCVFDGLKQVADVGVSEDRKPGDLNAAASALKTLADVCGMTHTFKGSGDGSGGGIVVEAERPIVNVHYHPRALQDDSAIADDGEDGVVQST